MATLGGLTLLGVVSRRARAAAALELGAYALSTAAATIRYRDPHDPTSAVALAATYPVLHFSYGTGMLRGLWQFRDRFSGPRRRGPTVGPGSRPVASGPVTETT